MRSSLLLLLGARWRRHSRALCRSAALPLLLLSALLTSAQVPTVPPAPIDEVTALRHRFQSLLPALADSPFKRPLTLMSADDAGAVQARLYAVLDQPFPAFSQALKAPAPWCAILMLHLYTRHCAVATQSGNAGPATPTMTVAMSRTHDEPLAKADRLSFTYQLRTETAEALDVRLSADSGPYATHDYRIALRAIPVDGGRKTFLALSYSYNYGMAARLAFQAYLATFGHSKVGFTVTGPGTPGAAPSYIGGTRGLIERNTMRYYLAIEAYLAAQNLAPPQRLEQRLAGWFDASEEYARQLHEVDRATYLDAKRSEHARLGLTQ